MYTDGASKGNPELSTYGFCIRNNKGDLIYAEASNIGLGTNIIAEAITVWKTIQYGRYANLHNMKVESDSLSVIKFIKG